MAWSISVRPVWVCAIETARAETINLVTIG